ncbi:hypothetical protein CCHL11_06252 [Colletotrichum chlorophyti]|uniref:Uncharacterized protein n=1 Tax=Colletotrichum chlorophyti TaxID=708187 RepID=A0A1Q8RLA0_9PEZI|nr:hypothetical protein CCHL11_06252 [Colletotrichum chlorophyti]
MFIPGIVQALIAALTFGTVIQAASSAVFPLAKGHGSNIFRDGLRLVLITFLVSAALWAQIDFIALTLDPTSTSGCQVAVIFTTIFDQLARLAVEQFLLWTINANSTAPTGGALFYQAVIGVRFVLGAVFVGFQKAQVATVCVTRSDALALGAVVMVTDFIIVLMLAFRTNSVSVVRGVKGGQPKKAIFWAIVGLAVWTATSTPMLLGIGTIELFFRTAVPAFGLSLLLGIVTGFSGSLLPPPPQQITHPGAQSPRNISSSRDISTSDTDYPPSRYEDLKTGTITTVTAFGQSRDGPRPEFNTASGGALPTIAGSVPGQAATGVGGVPVQGQLFPPLRAQTAPVRESLRVVAKPNLLNKRSIFDRVGPGTHNVKKTISNPILQTVGERNPLSKIATIDLATAAKNDRQRRDNDMATMQRSFSFNAQRPAPKPPAITAEEALKRGQSLRRKEVGPSSPPADVQSVKSAGLMSNPPATTSSAQLSPGVEEIRRRSPRQPPETHQQTEKTLETRPVTSPKQQVSVTNVSPPRPPRPERPLSSLETAERATSQSNVDRILSQKTLDRSASQKSNATTDRAVSPLTVPVPPPRSAARLVSPKQPDLPPTWPIQTVVDPTIRPSRQRPPSPKTPGGGLQRRPTGGLPSNPRAITMRPVPADGAGPQEQTVLFVNDILYNDPAAVQNIINGAASQATKTPHTSQSPGFTLKSSGSVVHRPRPIPRQQGKDRQIFPAENNVNHRRSRSGGSIISRKSILQSSPGSPTQLPPLPPPPKSAGIPLRPLPNNTKSMTFDEKMKLFFPRLPSSSGQSLQHRGSIPDMPTLPAASKPASTVTGEEKGGWDTESSRDQSKQSDRSTKTSIRTQSILEIEEAIRRPEPTRNISKFSIDTSVVGGRTDEHDSWVPDVPIDDRIRSKQSYDGAKRQSSPIIPVRIPSPSEFSETRTTRTRDEETTTNWGSIHSPVVPVNIQDVTHMPKPTWIQPRDDRNPRDLSMISHNDGKEVMTIMLDASIEHDRGAEVNRAHRSPAGVPEVNVADHGAHWHRRIGDDSITFSERKEKLKSRRMPPPSPLQLRSPSRKIAVAMQVAEPSPLESPEHAYAMIQAQLEKFEQPNRDSYESEGQRIRLLESLEAEMGQQEDQWHEMQHGLSRVSFSTAGTSSVRTSRHESAKIRSQEVATTTFATNVDAPPTNGSHRTSIAADRRASRRARMQSASSLNHKSSYEDLKSASSMSSAENNDRTSIWQQRLADAQTEYMENATELLAKRNLNFLSVSKAPLSAAQLGSPTPPDTDEESDGVHAQIIATFTPNERARPSAGLWRPISPIYPEREPTLLWAPAHHVATKSSPSGVGADDLPGPSVRPPARKTTEPLMIMTAQLWQPDHTAAKKLRNSFTSGLWRASWVPEPLKPQPSRPVTQRPPRRSKRITLLPDILESPRPLPDKKGTLGIFQFPWGEKSDTATVQPRPNHMLMAMPGTMSTGGQAIRAALEARAKQIEAQEYSSSFFDDYDEEEEDDDVVSDIDEDDESDDGFDETTLWEIASLLRSDQVPSKNSLLPQPIAYRPESAAEEEEYTPEESSSEYASEDEKMEDEEDTKHDSMVITMAANDLPAPSAPVSLLWTAKPKHFVSTRKAPGLPQPDARTWRGYTAAVDAPPRVQGRLPEPAVIHSTTLWRRSVAKPVASKLSNSLLWSKPQKGPRERRTPALWAALPAVVYTEPEGLFEPGHKRVCFRTTSAAPIGLNMPSAVRVTEETLPQLTSTSLWTAIPTTLQARNWISLAAVAPEAAMSGHSTPTLDTASTRSDMEEAVSDFEPLPDVPVQKVPWWDSSRPEAPAPVEADREGKSVFEPEQMPPSQPLRRNAASPEAWKTALDEAMASAPSRLVRTEASPAQRAEALDSAITSNISTEHQAAQPFGQMYEQQQQQYEQFYQQPYEQSYEQPYEQAYADEARQSADDDRSPAKEFQVPFENTVEEQVIEPAEDQLKEATTLWKAPAPPSPKPTSILWAPAILHAHDTSPLTPEDPETRLLRTAKRTPHTASPLVTFGGQHMWNRFYGAELRRVVPLGGGRDWLESAVKPSVSKVIFRY